LLAGVVGVWRGEGKEMMRNAWMDTRERIDARGRH
jgi:hypothetical protein